MHARMLCVGAKAGGAGIEWNESGRGLTARMREPAMLDVTVMSMRMLIHRQ